MPNIRRCIEAKNPTCPPPSKKEGARLESLIMAVTTANPPKGPMAKESRLTRVKLAVPAKSLKLWLRMVNCAFVQAFYRSLHRSLVVIDGGAGKRGRGRPRKGKSKFRFRIKGAKLED